MQQKENQLIFEAYRQIFEMSDKEKKLAALAPPYDKITRADVITGAKKKINEDDYEVDPVDAVEVLSKKHTKCKYAAAGCTCNCDECPDCQHNYQDMMAKVSQAGGEPECDYDHDGELETHDHEEHDLFDDVN